jgi:DNA-binding NarL/FixJ family response regulator
MASDKYKVLIVDDCALFRMRIHSTLLGCNLYPVFEAANYDEACDQLLKTPIHLVLLDISLPGKSGIELLRLIKKKYPDTKVMMVSNHVNDYYKQFCLLHGADHFFDKSLDFEKMEQMMSGIRNEALNAQT